MARVASASRWSPWSRPARPASRDRPDGSSTTVGSVAGGADGAGGPGRDLRGEVAGGQRPGVVVQGEPAEGVEVAGHARRDLGGCGHPADDPGGRLDAVDDRGQRPPAGERGVGEGDQGDGVGPGGGDVVGLLVAVDAGRDGGAGHLDRAVLGAQHGVRGQAQVVQPALAGLLQGARGLTGDPAGLLGRQRALLQQRGEGLGRGQGLLDDPGDTARSAHVEDAREPGVLDAGGTTGGVEDRGGVRVVAVEDRDGHVALERGVVGGPVLEVAAVGESGAQRIATPE